MVKKKSRAGCLRCKARHVKCDEQHPTCGACHRYLLVCNYPSHVNTHNAHGSSASSLHVEKLPITGTGAWMHEPEITKPIHLERANTLNRDAWLRLYSGAVSPLTDSVLGNRNTRDKVGPLLDLDVQYRPNWDLTLLNNYLTNVAPRPDLEAAFVRPGGFDWNIEVSKIAMQDRSILNSLLAYSALHLRMRPYEASLIPEEERKQVLQILPQQYLAIALRLHRHAAGNLTRETADSVCFGGLILMMYQFALVQTLPTNPWEPPLDWLRTGRAIGQIILVAQTHLDMSESSNSILRFLRSKPVFDPREIFTEANRAGLLWLLDSSDVSQLQESDIRDLCGDHELNDDNTKCVYHHTLSYIGHVRRMITSGEPPNHVKRALAAFSIWTPEPFHRFLDERRPRALAVLAYFFALWTLLEPSWLVGHAGRAQLRSIHDILPIEWKHKTVRVAQEFGIY